MLTQCEGYWIMMQPRVILILDTILNWTALHMKKVENWCDRNVLKAMKLVLQRQKYPAKRPCLSHFHSNGQNPTCPTSQNALGWRHSHAACMNFWSKLTTQLNLQSESSSPGQNVTGPISILWGEILSPYPGFSCKTNKLVNHHGTPPGSDGDFISSDQ